MKNIQESASILLLLVSALLYYKLNKGSGSGYAGFAGKGPQAAGKAGAQLHQQVGNPQPSGDNGLTFTGKTTSWLATWDENVFPKGLGRPAGAGQNNMDR